MSRRKWTLRCGASQVVTILLVLTIVALVGVIVVLLVGRESPHVASEGGRAEPEGQGPAPGERGTSPSPTPPRKPVGDSHRIREVLQQGKTYESTLKVGFQAQAMDADWGIKTTITLVYVAENRVRRTVEQNDGQTVVLLCHIVECRAVKLSTDAEVSFDLKQPGFAVLGILDGLLAGGGGTAVAVAVAPVAQKILTQASQSVLQKHQTKAKAMLDSLEGKRFRVTYTDGKGVVSLEPVDCTLNEEERLYLEGMSVLGDCYLLPDLQSRPGQYWDVEGRELIDLLPPSWRGRPSGVVTIERGADFKKGEKNYATLEIRSGTLRVDATDQRRRRLGEVTPRGKLYYNITDGYVDQAELTAQASMEEVSTDHLLWEARFETAPKLEIQYTCRRLEGPMGSKE